MDWWTLVCGMGIGTGIGAALASWGRARQEARSLEIFDRLVTKNFELTAKAYPPRYINAEEQAAADIDDGCPGS